jgi:lipoprotein-anchoring transpeptidase ErfK/SrfK
MPLNSEDVAPIRPEVADKRVVVDVNHQTVSCYEGNAEVRFCRVSTGAKYDSYGNVVDNWSTPLGDYHVVNRKYLSIHMAGGSAAAGYELFGVCWTSIFATPGVAFHSTYWHNNYGEPMSHGCVNMTPEDAEFIYRWSMPEAPYDPGKIEVQGYAGTAVRVIEG